jgi:general secretion pathway protein D
MKNSFLILFLFFVINISGCSDGLSILKNDKLQDKTQKINQNYLETNKNLLDAETFFISKDYESAKKVYDKVLLVDPESPRAKAGLAKIEIASRHNKLFQEASELMAQNKIDNAKAKIRLILVEDPNNPEASRLLKSIDAKNAKDLITPKKLNPTLNKKITMEFNNANLQNIFQIITRTTGINFVLDPNVRDDLKASIFVKDANYEEVIDFLLVMHQLGKKVLTDTSLLIYPLNKSAQYDELIIRTFFLTHAEAKQASLLIKQMIAVREVFIDEKLNSVTVKGTYDQIRDIEKLLQDEDIADPEVVLDVEILEVKRTKLTDIGVKIPDSLSVIGATDGLVTVDQLKRVNGGMLAFGMYPAGSGPVINLLRQDGDTNLLANPRIRVKSREKARIHIGDKIPIETTTASSTGYAVGKSATYLDVGLKLEVEPRVVLNNEVSIKVNLEVSNATLPTGAVYPTVNTRNTSTVMMSTDGETQVLAGLINDEDRKSSKKVPGLSSLPIIGRVFTDVNDSVSKTEVILLITPHVIRNIVRPDASVTEFYGGQAGNPRPIPMNFSPNAILQTLDGSSAGSSRNIQNSNSSNPPSIESTPVSPSQGVAVPLPSQGFPPAR